MLPLLGDGPVLELGAGNGKLLHPLRRAGVDVVALEISWHALRRLDGARVLADAACLPFRDGAFSAVLDIHCGGHLDAAGRAMLAAETRRVLRPGGHAFVERLGRDDLRAGQGTPVADDPEARELQDGRRTWFANADALDALYKAFEKVDEAEETYQVHLRGVPAWRQSVRCVYRA